MKFAIIENKLNDVEIKTPCFYTHYGSFYKLTDKYMITVATDLILRSSVQTQATQGHIKAISKGEYGEISQGMFIDQFDKAIESLSKFRL